MIFTVSVSLFFPSLFSSFIMLLSSQFVVIASTLTSSGLKYDDYVFPNWSNVVGWGVAMSSMLFVPVYAIYKFCSVPGTFKEVSNKIYLSLWHLDDSWNDRFKALRVYDCNHQSTAELFLSLSSRPVAALLSCNNSHIPLAFPIGTQGWIFFSGSQDTHSSWKPLSPFRFWLSPPHSNQNKHVWSSW